MKIPKVRPSINEENIIVWDWENTDINKESQGLSKETDSIQFRVIDTLKKRDKYDIIFDDDGPGEIADVVCISTNSSEIAIDLYDSYRTAENVIKTMSIVRNGVICDVNFRALKLPFFMDDNISFSDNGEYPCSFCDCLIPNWSSYNFSFENCDFTG